MTQRRPDSVVTVLQISDTHLHAAADSRMRGVTTYATLLVGARARAARPALAGRRRSRDRRHRPGREPRRLRTVSRDARAARRARALDPRQPRRPEAHGRDPEQRRVPVRRRAAPRAVVDRAAQHVPRGRGRGRARARALAGPAQGARARTRASTCSSRCIITRCRWAARGSTASRCATRRLSGKSSTPTPTCARVVCGHVHQALDRERNGYGS